MFSLNWISQPFFNITYYDLALATALHNSNKDTAQAWKWTLSERAAKCSAAFFVLLTSAIFRLRFSKWCLIHALQRISATIEVYNAATFIFFAWCPSLYIKAFNTLEHFNTYNISVLIYCWRNCKLSPAFLKSVAVINIRWQSSK